MSLAIRYLLAALGIATLCLGLAGLILPVLPGTPFLLLSAACFSRSSARFETWLVEHPKLGPPISAWRQSRAIPKSAKRLALAAMVVSSIVILTSAALPAITKVATLVVLAASAAYVATRPTAARR